MIPASIILALLICAPADTYYDRGMALARLERWEEAKSVFELGREENPSDARFSLELAGIAFKQRRYGAAKRDLERALRENPKDRYANDFLATLYSLDGNTEAALKYWNRARKPKIEQLRVEPALQVNPALLDTAFTFAPASVLELADFRSTEARLQFLEIFSSSRIDLEPRQDGSFDAVLRSSERNGWGDSRIGALVSLLAGVPYQTITPSWFNFRRSSVNLTSLGRWDKQKRRASVALSGPLGSSANLRYRLFADGRNENWIIHDLNLKRFEAGAEMRGLVGARWSWSSGVRLSHRAFHNVGDDSPLFSNGWLLKYRASADAWLLRLPEHRFTLAAGTSWESGRATRLFSKVDGFLEARWFPAPRGDSLELNARLSAGKMFGEAPFDELYILGLERDNDLPMRAHIGTRDGRKGSAPLGRTYGLFNGEAYKAVHQNALFRVKLGPFVDTGSISGPFGSQKWLWDVGLQCKVVARGGVGVVFSYGKALRSGTNAYYATVTR